MNFSVRECDICDVRKLDVLRLSDDDIMLTMVICSQCCNGLWKRKTWLIPEIRQCIGKMVLAYIHTDKESKTQERMTTLDHNHTVQEPDWTKVNYFTSSGNWV